LLFHTYFNTYFQ